MNTDYDSWADIYDDVYSFVDNDIDFYRNKSDQLGGNILEIGCGTGRVTIPLLANGYDVTGVDSSTKMLAKFQSKIKKSGYNAPLKITNQDVRNLSLNEKFNLVIFPYRGFQSLLSVEDQIAALTSIKAHLTRNSILIIDIFVPNNELFDQKPDIFYHLKDSEYGPRNNIRSLHHRTEFDLHNQLLHTQISISEIQCNQLISKRYANFTLRYLYTDEARHLFEYCGYDIEEIAGDYDGSPYNRDSNETIWSLVLR